MSGRLSHQQPSSTPAAAEAVESLALPPPASLPSNLTRKLQDLAPYQMQFVDSLGTLHSDKSLMLNQKIPPLVSFRKESNGSFRVYAGLPPRNMTHCGSGEVPERNHLNKLPNMQGPVILNSGDWIALTAKLPIPIPLFRNVNPQSPQEKLGELIASADVGQTLVLGRSVVPECPGEVSRAHISVTVLDRQQLSPTRVAIRLVAIPGIEGTQPIFHLKPDGRLEQIVGSKEISPGATIQIGEQGERFTLPYPKNSLDDASIIYHQSILRGDKEANQSVMSVFGRDGLKRAQFHALREYVVKALDMIREGKSVEALDHLRAQSREVEAAGYSLSENNQVMLPRLTQGAVEENLHEVAKRSWFKPGQLEIYPSIGVLGPKAQPTNEAEHKLLALWQKNVALIYAEEYVHALQEMNGGAISDYTPLFGGKHNIDDEADVALFFKRHGIDLSDGLFTNRYPVRPAALQRVEGTQTRDEELLFKARVLAAPLNTPVSLNDTITIARTEAGFVVTPSQSLKAIFYMKPQGAAQELIRSVTLQGGDVLYLGSRRFQLPLPTT